MTRTRIAGGWNPDCPDSIFASTTASRKRGFSILRRRADFWATNVRRDNFIHAAVGRNRRYSAVFRRMASSMAQYAGTLLRPCGLMRSAASQSLKARGAVMSRVGFGADMGRAEITRWLAWSGWIVMGRLTRGADYNPNSEWDPSRTSRKVSPSGLW
jgi:hypothetical protein